MAGILKQSGPPFPMWRTPNKLDSWTSLSNALFPKVRRSLFEQERLQQLVNRDLPSWDTRTALRVAGAQGKGDHQ